MGFRQIAARLSNAAFIAAGLLTACGGGGDAGSTGPAVPVITGQPAAVTANDGANASFTVTASGTGLSYQWRRDGVALSDGASVSGATTATLTIVTAYSANGQRFTSVVSNSAGSVESTSATLTVTPVPPTVVSHPASSTVAVGQSATFTVALTGGTAPLSYQWQRNGVAIAGAAAPSYTLAAATLLDDGASFSVAITNPAGTLSTAAALLSVNAPTSAWSAPYRVSDTAPVQIAGSHGHLSPRVALDDAGNVTAVYRQVIGTGPDTRFALYANRRESATWLTPIHIVGTDSNVGAPQVAASGNGHVYIAFPQILETGVYSGFATRYVSSSWQSPSFIESVAGYEAIDVHVGVSSTGRATTVWSQSDGNFLRIQSNRSDETGAWPALAQIMDGGAFSSHPRVAVGANGDAVTVWAQRVGSDDRLFVRRHAGAGWSAPVELALPVGPPLVPASVAVDASGNAMVVISQFNAGVPVVKALHLSAATGNWAAPQSLGAGINPRIAVGASGHFVATWTESNQRVAIGRFSLAGVAGTAQFVQAPNTPAGMYPEVGVDAEGNAVVAWLQPRTAGHLTGDIHAAFCPANEPCGAPHMLTAGGTVDASADFEPALAVNAEGAAAVVWWERAADTQSAIWASVLE